MRLLRTYRPEHDFLEDNDVTTTRIVGLVDEVEGDIHVNFPSDLLFAFVVLNAEGKFFANKFV